VVIQLTDDDGDGRITACDVPELVTTSKVFSGDTGDLLFEFDEPECANPVWHQPAGGDIDADGWNEIVFADRNGEICAFDASGALLWKTVEEGSRDFYQDAKIWDLDGDGAVEVISGALVVRGSDGSTLWRNEGDGRSIITDLDLDGGWDLISGWNGRVYRPDGSEYPDRQYTGTIAGVANIDGDLYPEVVSLLSSRVTARDEDGRIIWEREGMPMDLESPHCFGDFDGDGLAEVAFTSDSFFIALDHDGADLWSYPVDDHTGNNAGCAVFDFEGDGSLEIVYKDSVSVRIFDSRDGEVLWQHEIEAGTQREAPVIADVDGDEAAEIVLGGTAVRGNQGGIVVFGSPAWAIARRVWNQESYSVTHVEEDGGIVSNPVPRWLTANDFRAQASTCPCSSELAAGFIYALADCASPTFCFDAAPSVGRPTDYRWDFGDGSPGESGERICHVFPAPGVYAVLLTVEDDEGCVKQAIRHVTAPSPLRVGFEPPPECTVNPVCLTGTASDGIPPYELAWDFGDGSPMEFGTEVCHEFPGGLSQISLFARDDAGCLAEIRERVLVFSPDMLPEVSGMGSATPLRVAREGEQLRLTWEETGFETGIYAGEIESLRSIGYTHAATGQCRASGGTALIPLPRSDAYFLAVAGACENPRYEGAYGHDSSGAPRPSAADLGNPSCP
jgi:hypothetical protein